MLQWADTFNRYGGNPAFMLNGLYAENQGSAIVVDPDPTATGKVLKLVSGLIATRPYWGKYIRKVFTGPAATIGISMRIWLSALPTGGGDFVQPIVLTDSNNATQLTFRIMPTGAINVYRGDDNGTLLGSSSFAVVANAWQHLEIKAKIDAAVGTVEIRVNTNVVLALTNQNTKNTAFVSASNVVLSNANIDVTPFTDLYIKDFTIWDATGTFNNDFLGNCLVIDIDTDSDVALGWTPNAGGAGWSILHNNPPTDDAAYIGAATAGLTNTFGLADLPVDVTTVKGGVIVNRSRKIDGGDGNVQMGLISGAATGLGADRPITTAYTYWTDVFEVDPNTGAPFTPANFNLTKLKMTRTL